MRLTGALTAAATGGAVIITLGFLGVPQFWLYMLSVPVGMLAALVVNRLLRHP